ncbi:MAG TPA: CHRD domain-containing protein, partial [Xanthomonadales bacterium]|nr:CHRD domain-containing protein [Xanthomonadales bacterium]
TFFLLLVLLPATAVAQTFFAPLTGANEVPPGDPDGTGSATIQLVGTTVNYTINVTNVTLPPTMQHIHSGAPGVNGPIVVDLPGAWVGGTLSGSTTTTPETAAAIASNAASFYVNVHTTDFPDGAVRGQLGGIATTSNIPSLDERGLLALVAVLLVAGGVWLARRA